ncbi:sialin-like [Planococcus citri]|uniref:sialin-like n=1 Tax=Planococcus citri TaxID=170843 RepID=UPI0031F7301F
MEADDKEDKYHRYRYRDPSAPRNEQNAPSIWFSKRFNITVLLFMGYLMHGIIFQVTGISLADMTTDRVIVNQTNNMTIIKPSDFQWDLKTEEIILSMFWIGFLFSICGGFVAQKYGGARTLGISMMLTGIILAMNPICARIHCYLFALFQIVTGILQGLFLVSTAEIFAHWMPMRERTVLMSFAINGIYVAAVVMHRFFSSLAYNWQWTMNFYVSGIVCFVWSIIWLNYVENEPMKDKRISEKEFEYIWQEPETLLRKRQYILPYMDILLSPSCWALFFCEFAFGWASVYTLTYLPLNYIKDVTNEQTTLEINGVYFILLILDIVSIFTVPITGILINFWLNSDDRISFRTELHIISVMYIVVGFSFVALALLITVTTHFSPPVSYLLAIKPLLPYCQIILQMIPVHMAPNHSSLLSGFAVFWQTVGILCAQTFIKRTVQDHRLEDWYICFQLSAAILASSALIFMCFGSSKPQPWSSIPRSPDKREIHREESKELVVLSKKTNLSTTESSNKKYEEELTELS